MDNSITNYKIIEKIADGLQGSVFKVRNKTDNIIYAMKISKDRYRSHKEYELLKEINHKNIIKVINFFNFVDKSWIILEYMPKTLLDFNHIKLSEETIKKIIKSLINSIEFLHDNNIYHKDIKLDNILIDEHYNINKLPSDISITGKIKSEHKKLYDLIWKRTVASQMQPAKYYDIGICIKNETFKNIN